MSASAPEQPLEKYLTAREVAELIGCTQSAVYKWAERGAQTTAADGTVSYGPRLPSIRAGALLRFRAADVRAWLEGRSASTQPLNVRAIRPGSTR